MQDNWFYLQNTEMPAEKQAAGASLKANISIKGHFTRTFPWAIEKSVVPAIMDIAPGATGTATFTITAIKSAGADKAFIDGRVCITNTGSIATKNLAAVINVNIPPHSIIIASANVDISEHPILAPGETICYDYRVDIPGGSITPNKTYRVAANVTITNHLGHMGIPFGPSPSDTVTLSKSPAPINGTIHADDTNGKSYTFNSSGTKTYEKKFSCNDAGTTVNTATIRETGQQASASVEVTCGCPAIINETVSARANVKITPKVGVGIIEYFCVGEPVMGAGNGTPTEKCRFSVSQSICVQIPLTFSVNTSAVPAGIVCGISPEGRCSK